MSRSSETAARTPTPDGPSDVTRLLRAAEEGDPGALDRLIPLVYDDLRRIARRRMALEADGHTLNTTAVVHEAYAQLAGQEPAWNDRRHFFAVASRVMRHILIDHARAHRADKRGGDRTPVPLDEAGLVSDPGSLDLLALDEALEQLAGHDARLARVVECRFFGGLTMEETAEALGISERTANRDWRRARVYLYELLHG
jgi:RNA polymerase sigma factor (TIGR02999 family)